MKEKHKHHFEEDEDFASGAFMMITGTGKELVEGGLKKETRMMCPCGVIKYVEVGKLPTLL